MPKCGHCGQNLSVDEIRLHHGLNSRPVRVVKKAKSEPAARPTRRWSGPPASTGIFSNRTPRGFSGGLGRPTGGASGTRPKCKSCGRPEDACACGLTATAMACYFELARGPARCTGRVQADAFAAALSPTAEWPALRLRGTTVGEIAGDRQRGR